MRKVYSSAPLPFMGQKRRFIKKFKDVINDLPADTIFVDMFGGSGLLSHTISRCRPNAQVIYNDYDYYCDRIKNVNITNEILGNIRPLLSGVKKDKKVPNDIRSSILNIIKDYDNRGYVDYITLSSSLLFSGKYAVDFNDISKHTMYNVCRVADYECDGYLDDLVVVHCDYRDLFSKFKDTPGAVFLIDPPYLSTDVGSYKCYWKLVDYLDVLKCLDSTNYIYFTSGKSQIVELCEWLRKNPNICNTFEGAKIHTQQNNVNWQAVFTDMMLVRTA